MKSHQHTSPLPAAIFLTVLMVVTQVCIADDPSQLTTRELCDKLNVEAIEWNPSSYMTFSPLATETPNLPYWQLNWYGVDTPIPAVKYTILALQGKDRSWMSASLFSPENGLWLTLTNNYQGLFSFDSVFGSLPRPDREAVSYHKAYREMFQLTPEDIDCESWDNLKQIDIIGFLLQKRIIVYEKGSTVHDAVGQNEGILISTFLQGMHKWVFIAPDSDNANRMTRISYYANAGSPYRDFGTTISEERLNPEPPPPWIYQLQFYLANWDIGELANLAEIQNWKFRSLPAPDAPPEVVPSDVKRFHRVTEPAEDGE